MVSAKHTKAITFLWFLDKTALTVLSGMNNENKLSLPVENRLLSDMKSPWLVWFGLRVLAIVA